MAKRGIEYAAVAEAMLPYNRMVVRPYVGVGQKILVDNSFHRVLLIRCTLAAARTARKRIPLIFALPSIAETLHDGVVRSFQYAWWHR